MIKPSGKKAGATTFFKGRNGICPIKQRFQYTGKNPSGNNFKQIIKKLAVNLSGEVFPKIRGLPPAY